MRTASLTADGVAGRAIFQAQGCAQCHGGANFTDSGAATLRDIGTISSRAAAIDSADRSPGSIRRRCAGSGRRRRICTTDRPRRWRRRCRRTTASSISAPDLAKLVAYLKQIDGDGAGAAAGTQRHDESGGDDHDADRAMRRTATTATPLSLGGTASDNVGVTQVTWSNDRGGSGTASGTTRWSVSGIALQTGQNVLTVTARDAAGNTATDQLTVTYTPPADGTPPTVTITTPTSQPDARRDDDPAVDRRDGLGQRGRDAGDLGERPGRQRHGDRDDELVGERDRAASGANVLTVTARDAAGNTSTDHVDGDLHAGRTRRSRR